MSICPAPMFWDPFKPPIPSETFQSSSEPLTPSETPNPFLDPNSTPEPLTPFQILAPLKIPNPQLLPDPTPSWILPNSPPRPHDLYELFICLIWCSSGGGPITVVSCISIHQIDRQPIPLLSPPQIHRWKIHTSYMGSYLSIYVFQHVQTYNAFCILSL